MATITARMPKASVIPAPIMAMDFDEEEVDALGLDVGRSG
jgi:hypothetical protein